VEANKCVWFPWPPLEARLAIPDVNISVKRQFFDTDLIIHPVEFTLMPNHKLFINIYIEKKNSSVDHNVTNKPCRINTCTT
jgi:hypothetical protein